MPFLTVMCLTCIVQFSNDSCCTYTVPYSNVICHTYIVPYSTVTRYNYIVLYSSVTCHAYIVSYSTLSCCTYIVSYAIVTCCTYIVPYSTDTNNFVILFAYKEMHKLTWISPNQTDKKQIDHILICGKWRRSLQDVGYRSRADVGSNHHHVVAHIKLKIKRTVTPIRLLKWFNVSKLKDAGIRPVMQY